MADVSHELGALRFVVDSPLSSKVAMFNKQTQQHQQQQLLNPFSAASGRVSPKPTFSKGEYGKPLAGSLTEMRGQKANMHVMREMLELCQIIDSEGYDVKDEPKMRVIPFGELFNIYNYISDKVVGILLRARKHKLLDFEGEMLFQRRDDDVPIFLLKPIVEIRQELNAKIEEIKRAGSPAPLATSLLLDKSEQKLKVGSQNSTPSASPAPSKPATPAQSKASSPAPSDVEKTKTAPAPTKASDVEKAKSTQSPPEVTITDVTDVQVPETEKSSEQTARLEGGQEAKKSGNKSSASAPPAATTTETVENVNQLTPPELEPVIAEHPEVPVPTSAENTTSPNAMENIEMPTIIIEASGMHTRTVPAAHENATAAVPTLAEPSGDAAATAKGETAPTEEAK